MYLGDSQSTGTKSEIGRTMMLGRRSSRGRAKADGRDDDEEERGELLRLSSLSSIFRPRGEEKKPCRASSSGEWTLPNNLGGLSWQIGYYKEIIRSSSWRRHSLNRLIPSAFTWESIFSGLWQVHGRLDKCVLRHKFFPSSPSPWFTFSHVVEHWPRSLNMQIYSRVQTPSSSLIGACVIQFWGISCQRARFMGRRTLGAILRLDPLWVFAHFEPGLASFSED